MTTPDYARERLRRLCLRFPEAVEVEAWGDPTYRVRNKSPVAQAISLIAFFASNATTTNANIKALVYIAAFGPVHDESILCLPRPTPRQAPHGERRRATARRPARDRHAVDGDPPQIGGRK